MSSVKNGLCKEGGSVKNVGVGDTPRISEPLSFGKRIAVRRLFLYPCTRCKA